MFGSSAKSCCRCIVGYVRSPSKPWPLEPSVENKINNLSLFFCFLYQPINPLDREFLISIGSSSSSSKLKVLYEWGQLIIFFFLDKTFQYLNRPLQLKPCEHHPVARTVETMANSSISNVSFSISPYCWLHHSVLIICQQLLSVVV